jgi:hypothetical protein
LLGDGYVYCPNACTEGNKPFDDEQYIEEPKMDGIRLILSTLDGVKAYTRQEMKDCPFSRVVAATHSPGNGVG